MRLIKAQEPSEILGVRLPRLYELVRLKAVPFVRLGDRQIRFDPELLASWIKREATTNGARGNHSEEQQ